MIRAILFDKDGTFTDFRKTWEGFIPGAIRALGRDSGAEVEALAVAIGVDMTTGRILPNGRFVTASNLETAQAMVPVTGWDLDQIMGWWRPRVVAVPQVAVTDLPPYLAALRGRGLSLGILSNADEAEARDHAAELGALPFLDRVIGCDSGYGAKPAPEGAAAFADDFGLARDQVLMVGDGMTDMLAARGAGLRAVAVTTGTLSAEALAPHAEAVLPDITHLPHWLDQQAT